MLFALQPLIINYKLHSTRYLTLHSKRYLIIMYVWRIPDRPAPNCALPVSCGIHSHWHIRRGRYSHVPRVSHQTTSTVQTIYDMEVSLHEAPCIIIAKYDQLFIRILHTSTGHISKKIYLMSLRHLDTHT